MDHSSSTRPDQAPTREPQAATCPTPRPLQTLKLPERSQLMQSPGKRAGRVPSPMKQSKSGLGGSEGSGRQEGGLAMKAGRAPRLDESSSNREAGRIEGKTLGPSKMRPLKAGRVATKEPSPNGPSKLSGSRTPSDALGAKPANGSPSTDDPLGGSSQAASTAAKPRLLASTSNASTKPAATPARTPRRIRPPTKSAVRARASLVPRQSLAFRTSQLRPPSSHSLHSDAARTVGEESVASSGALATVSRGGGKLLRGALTASVASTAPSENDDTPPTASKPQRREAVGTPGRSSALGMRGAPASTVRQPQRQPTNSRLPVATPAQQGGTLLSRKASKAALATGDPTLSTAMKRGHLLRRRSSTSLRLKKGLSPPLSNTMPSAPYNGASLLPPSTSSVSLFGAHTLGASIESSISTTSLRELRRKQGSAASWSTVDGEDISGRQDEATAEDDWTDRPQVSRIADSIDVAMSPSTIDNRPSKLPQLVSSRSTQSIATQSSRSDLQPSVSTTPTAERPSLVRNMARSFERLGQTSDSPTSPPGSLPSRDDLSYGSPPSSQQTPHSSSLLPRRIAAASSFSPALDTLAATLRAKHKASTSIEDMLSAGGSNLRRSFVGTPGRLLTDEDSTQTMVDDITMTMPADLTPDKPPPARRPRIVSGRPHSSSTPETPDANGGRGPLATSTNRRRTSTAAKVVVSAQLSALTQDLEATRTRERQLIKELAQAQQTLIALKAEETRALALEEQLEELRATHAITEREAAAERESAAEKLTREEAKQQALRATLVEVERRMAELQKRSDAGLDVPIGVAQARVSAAGAKARSAYRLLEYEAGSQLEVVRSRLEFLACLKSMLPAAA